MTPKKSKNIMYCDQCHDLMYPPEPFYQVGGRIICTICWGDAPEPNEEGNA